MKLSKTFTAPALTLIILTTTSAATAGPEKTPDWRKTGTPQEQLKALVEITPGTHHWMPEIAYRYQSLYWAAEQGKWDFADYQVKSMEKMIKRVAKARTKRAASIKAFRNAVFDNIYRATASRDFATFNTEFARMGAECTACHAKEGFPFIVVPSTPPKPNSVVLGFPE